jgi:hypothetical protein
MQALNSAQLLKNSPSSANMANYADIFDGPAEGHVPTAWEQQSGDANADRAETALGAGPAIDALRRAMDEQRLQGSADVRAGLADNQLVEDDFNANGLNRGMAHANVANEIGDVNSEAKARRGFLPWGQAQNERDTENAFGLADARYAQPARTRAQGDVASAQIGAQGRIGAAQATHGNPVEALQKALHEMLAQGKSMQELEAALPQLKQVYGVQ